MIDMNERVNAMRLLEKAVWDRDNHSKSDLISALIPVSLAFFDDRWLEFRDFISAAVKCNSSVTTEQLMNAMDTVGMLREDTAE